MTTKGEAAHDVRGVLESVKAYMARPDRPKLSEADTRAHFLDPLLRALGYHSIGDIQHEVYIEPAKQYLDYLLVVDALPRVAVEAKAIDVGLNDTHGAQVVQYCSVLGIEWAVVSNARQWRLYHGFAKGALPDKLLSAIDLLDWQTDAEYDAVFEQLWLISKDAFQTADGPEAWLTAKHLDTALRQSLLDPASAEVRYIRKRLADQSIPVTTDLVAEWFKSHLQAARAVGPNVRDRAEPGPSVKLPVPAPAPAPAATEHGPRARRYYRVMLGRHSAHAAECFAGGFIGADFGIEQNLSNELPDDWRVFNKKFIPVFLAKNPDAPKVTAGLACGALWTVTKGLSADDIVLCPDGQGRYRIGKVSGNYYYEPAGVLPHRRPVTWMGQSIPRSSMSAALRNSTGSIGTVSNVTGYGAEIEVLVAEQIPVSGG